MPKNNELIFCLVPFGKIPEWIMKYSAEVIAENFGARTANLPGRSLPRKARVPKKDAYDANYLLDDLKMEAYFQALLIVGLTTEKICNPADDSNLDGLAVLGGPAILVAVPSDAAPNDTAKLVVRNVLLHELGHLFGLNDRSRAKSRLTDILFDKLNYFLGIDDGGCKKNCLMNDKAKSATPNLEFCPVCKERIRKILSGEETRP